MAAFRAFVLLVLTGLLLSAPAAEPQDAQADAPVWPTQATPGPAVTLRVKFNVGKVLVYEGTLLRAQKSANSYDEKDNFYLTFFCSDHKDGLDRLALRRTYTDRKRSERLANGKTRDVVPLDNPSELIDLGPNYDPVGNLRCYVFDNQNRLAYHTEQFVTLKDGRALQGRILREDADKIQFLTNDNKFEFNRAEVVDSRPVSIPHIFLNDTPHYLFPMFSQKKVAPGDTWRFSAPVILPIEQGNPPRVFPTQFNVTMVGRLREVREREGSVTAIVDYQVRGLFDSAAPEFAARFPEGFAADNRLTHKISGTGEAWVDLDKGRIIYKRESFDIALYAAALTSQGADKPLKKVESEAQINSQYEIKLLPPGTRLKSGAVIPEYD